MGAAPVFPPFSTDPKSGIIYLRDAVAKFFSDNSIPATVPPVGLKYRSFTLNQTVPGNANRVVFIPGEFDGTLPLQVRPYGTLSRETRNATSVRNPRELVAWDRPITLSIWSAPIPGRPEDEGSAIAIAEDLLEQTVRAVTYTSINGVSLNASIVWGDVNIVSPPNENSFGIELLVSLIQKGPLFDITLEVVQAEPVITFTYT